VARTLEADSWEAQTPMDDAENTRELDHCAFCGRVIRSGQETSTAPTLGIEVHTACYQTEYGRREPTRFIPPK
jgi:hypothetical protein